MGAGAGPYSAPVAPRDGVRRQHEFDHGSRSGELNRPGMYILMYAMVNTFDNVFTNVNRFYKAGLMAAPTALIELGVMGLRRQHPKRPN